MWRVTRACKLLVATILVGSALVVTPEAPGAQERMDATAARYEERAAAEAERRRRARAERRWRMGQQAHARMPSTMYASTPDPAPPPHPAHSGALEVSAKRAHAVARVTARSAGG